MVIISLGGKIYGGGDSGVGWCFIHGRNPDQPSMQWGVFYYPLIFWILWGSVNMCLIIATLVSSARKTGTDKQPGWWLRYLRTLVFIVCFNVLLLFIFLYRAVAWFKEGEWTDSATKYVQCLLFEKPQYDLLGVPFDCGAKPKSSPSVDLWYLIHFAASAQGLVNFCIYGLMFENFSLWINWAGTWLGSEWCMKLGTKDDDKGSSGGKSKTTQMAPVKNQASKRDLGSSSNLNLSPSSPSSQSHDAPAQSSDP